LSALFFKETFFGCGLRDEDEELLLLPFPQPTFERDRLDCLSFLYL